MYFYCTDPSINEQGLFCVARILRADSTPRLLHFLHYILILSSLFIPHSILIHIMNFFKGHPSLELLPRDELAEMFESVISETPLSGFESDPYNRHPLQYGTDLGNLTTRSAIAEWLDIQFSRSSADASKINLTGGASYGAANALLACTSPHLTKHAFVVLPTYFLINYAFIDAGFGGHMSAVRETPGGEYDIDLETLEERLNHLDAVNDFSPVEEEEINVFPDPTGRGDRKLYRYVMYLVPSFSNPGGLLYSEKTRERLVAVARKHDMLLLSDDVYDHLHYDRNPFWRKLNHVDEDSLPSGWRFGNTISNCSFSKIIAPGLRVGWQETVSLHLALQLATTGANKSGGTPGQLQTAVVEELVSRGLLDDIIASYRKTYKARAHAMHRALKVHLPPRNTSIFSAHGGYFFWVDIEGVDLAATFAELEEKHGVVIPDGGHFEVHDEALGWSKRGARLSVSYLGEEDIEDGIRLWGEVLRDRYPDLY